jgi:hypothetical protein
LLQQREIIVAGNTEQVPDAGLLETVKQEVADLHASAGNAGQRFCLYLAVHQTILRSYVLKRSLDASEGREPLFPCLAQSTSEME